MKIIQAHNKYKFPGGEDVVVEQERQMLENAGHDVVQWIKENTLLEGMSFARKLEVFLFSFWSPRSYFELRALLKKEKPDVMHVHNTLPQLTPSIYYAAKHAGVRIVQTIHNYRLVAPCALLYRKGSVCEKCNGKWLPWQSILLKCYRESALQSTLIFLNRLFDKLTQVYQTKVDQYICLTEFSKAKLMEANIPSSKITIKPNFTNSQPDLGEHQGGFALYVGRISEEKGVSTLVKAWEKIGEKLPLKVAGTGPLLEKLKAKSVKGVEFLGWSKAENTKQLMKDAAVLIFPSEWYEGFPMVFVEAMKVGLPILSSDIGSQNEIIEEGVNGWKFKAGNAESLVEKVFETLKTPQLDFKRIIKKATKDYLQEENIQHLVGIYQGSE